MRVYQEVEGAMYAFPKIELPAAAVEAAEEAGQVTERERHTHRERETQRERERKRLS